MTTTHLLRNIAAFSILALSTAFAAFAADYEKEFSVAPGGTLDIETDAGSVKVLTHSSASAIVEARIEGRDADDFSVSSGLNGNTLEVRGTVDGKKWSRHLKVEFIITVPEEFHVELDTAGGSIHIADLTGNINAHTSGGSIRIGAIKGDVELNTSGGSIKTEAVYGALNAHTSGGSIRATFAEQLKDDAILDTSGGSITAYIVEDAQIDLDASTSGGRVRTDFAVNGRVKKRSIRGEINGGGPTLKLRTSGGSVAVLTL